MPRKIKLASLLLFSLYFQCFSQENSLKRDFIDLEYMAGKIIPNAQVKNFPATKAQQVVAINFGSLKLDTNSWRKYYNFPEIGLTFLYSNLGNNQIFGHQLGILPFASFGIFRKYSNSYRLKLSAGVSYFNNPFDANSNPRNEIIGSHITWDIKTFLYREIRQSKKFSLKLGIGFSHESNGHTVLPNLGVNTFLLSLSGQFYQQENNNYNIPKRIKKANRSPKSYFLNAQYGYGFHEQDNTEGPLVNRSKPVYSTSFAYGIVFSKHIKLRTGIMYRFYEQYNTHLKENNIEGLSENRIRSSSNIVIFIGNEFLMGHIGLDVRLGINAHKPFYKEFNPKGDFATVTRRIFSSRVGMNLYLKNTYLSPTHNFFVGAHINANAGKADFTEFSLGYHYKLN